MVISPLRSLSEENTGFPLPSVADTDQSTGLLASSFFWTVSVTLPPLALAVMLSHASLSNVTVPASVAIATLGNACGTSYRLQRGRGNLHGHGSNIPIRIRAGFLPGSGCYVNLDGFGRSVYIRAIFISAARHRYERPAHRCGRAGPGFVGLCGHTGGRDHSIGIVTSAVCRIAGGQIRLYAISVTGAGIGAAGDGQVLVGIFPHRIFTRASCAAIPGIGQNGTALLGNELAAADVHLGGAAGVAAVDHGDGRAVGDIPVAGLSITRIRTGGSDGAAGDIGDRALAGAQLDAGIARQGGITGDIHRTGLRLIEHRSILDCLREGAAGDVDHRVTVVISRANAAVPADRVGALGRKHRALIDIQLSALSKQIDAAVYSGIVDGDDAGNCVTCPMVCRVVGVDAGWRSDTTRRHLPLHNLWKSCCRPPASEKRDLQCRCRNNQNLPPESRV